MDFEPCFKVHKLVSVHPKSIILGQMINLDMIFHVLVSVYRLVKIWNSSSSLLNFGTAYEITLNSALSHKYWSCTRYSIRHALNHVFFPILCFIENCTELSFPWGVRRCYSFGHGASLEAWLVQSSVGLCWMWDVLEGFCNKIADYENGNSFQTTCTWIL